MITILGPTATGKTRLAAAIADKVDGEIISADSRQVYRGMDIGTGKDLNDYYINGRWIPYQLIDIIEPGEEYNVYEFQKDFMKAYKDILAREKTPIMCGGSGMYLESVLKGYNLLKVPENESLRWELNKKSDPELKELLKAKSRKLHNTTDLTDRHRMIRAIEIQIHYENNPGSQGKNPEIESVLIGIHYDRLALRQRITERLYSRLENGLVEEVQHLLDTKVSTNSLRFYGLEYRFVTDYLTGKLDYNTMVSKLNTAIHQFAKRQVTWFRRMERSGHTIHWIDGQLSLEKKLAEALKVTKAKGY
ncbi:MAG: tRNA (adenosine(37)-N6)-dimethylallyltransferase MiaA [Bacteroidales bacterium]|nr:tRNA (adenosine(37)-N6)-dimethylallyltransferase MiaA [Bacteroidales bacterium]MCF8333667.1 tRNA (adenosine(37)-N6)-dimethylallyltransferase MiaA [Bacteroidales bacterium]